MGLRERALVVIVLLAGIAIPFHRTILFGETPSFRDLDSFYRPLTRLTLRLARETGGLPQWDPYSGSGRPYLANPNSGFLHPFFWPAFVAPFEIALALQSILPVAVTFVGAFVLCRAREATPVAAATGAAVWAFGGVFQGAVAARQIGWTYAALPLAAGSLLSFLNRGKGRDAALLSAALGLCVLAAEPSAIVGSALVLVAIAWEGRSTVPTAHRGARALLACSLGLGIGAVQLLPAACLALKTTRLGARSGDDLLWSFPPARILELLSPRVFGFAERDMVMPGWYWGASMYPVREAPYFVSIYAGLLAIPLAVSAIAARGRRPWAWVLVGTAGLLLALGGHGPVRALIGGTGQRYPERFLPLLALAIAVMCAQGMDAIARDAGARRSASAVTLALALLGAAVVIGLFAIDRSDRSVGLRLSVPAPGASSVGALLTSEATWRTCIALCGFLALWRGRAATWQAAAILGIMLVDLLPASAHLIPARRPAGGPPAILAEAGAGAIYDATVYDARRRLARDVVDPPVPASFGVATAFEADFDRSELAWSARATEAFLALAAHDVALARAVLERRGVASILAISDDAPGKIAVIRLEDPAPLAFSPSRIARAPEEQWGLAVERLGPAARRATVLHDGSSGEEPSSPASVTVTGRRPGRLELDLDSAAPAVIAINATWNGWAAFVDTAAVPVVRADVSLMAIRSRRGATTSSCVTALRGSRPASPSPSPVS
ncbi:MAG: hypothetical protein U0166_13500 [Acidobacteriota bacterium]